ncbi:MAG: branched-chain amino acid ABC transporter permease [Synergistaceae bacterium]|jgi:branched-chain amino acid transport system permease protein|nr:branched-chain amino acid ABC transporter permease [Synergistaceae bacterium]
MKNKYKILLFMFALLIPPIIRNEYYVRIVNIFYMYSVVALSINLIVGFCGQLDMGRAAFMGLGAYCSAILTVKMGLPFIAAFLISGAFSGLIGAVLGFLCRKSAFDYLTLVTIGFNAICQIVFLNWIPVTGGVMGISRVPQPNIFGFHFDTNTRFYYLALFFLAASFIAMHRICNSRMGRAFEAIRDDSIAAEYSGINVQLYKILNFAIGSVFTGLTGALFVHYTQYASPFNYTLDESIYQLQMAILGGLGSLAGSLVGTFILVVLPEISRSFYEYRLLFVGILMVVMMLYFPNGLLGKEGVGERLIAVRLGMLGGKNSRKDSGG